MNIIEKIDRYLKENSTEDAKKTLDKCISFYEKLDNDDKETKEVLSTMKGILDYYNKNGSFTPDQAKAIYNISKGIEKMVK